MKRENKTSDSQEISKKKLQTALEIVKPGLANKDIIEQSTSFAFLNGCVITYNDEISISHPVEGLNLTGAVKADKLYQLLAKLKSDEITLVIGKNEIGEENEIILTCGKSKAGLTLQAEIKLPLDEELSHDEKWKKIPDTFIKLLSFAKESSSRDMSQPKLTCVNITKEGRIEASDNFRIVRCELGCKMPTKTFLLPSSSASTVIKINPVEVAEGRGWVHFRNDLKTVISCRILEEKYADISPHLIMEKDSLPIIFPVAISEILDRASIFAKRDHVLDESVTITLMDKVLKIRGDSETGWFEEEVPFRYKGDPLTFYITPYLLKGILSETLNGILSEDKLKFEGENWVYVTALKSK